jgi:TatD DNase family protein
MSLIDTHTHLESFARSGTLPAALARAREAGLEAMITIGTGSDDWELYRGLAEVHAPLVRFSVGLHPCSVGENWAAEVARMEAFGSAPGKARPVALGECGLDRYHLPKDDAARAEQIIGWQKEAFAFQLALARRLECPVVVHSRHAFRETVDLIDASGVDWRRVVFHCFSEGEAEMAELIRRGGRGSFTGILTYKAAETIRAAAKLQGLDRFLLETDAPYLTPMPHRGKPNEPAFLRHTADYAAGLFGVDLATLSRVSTANAKAFFGL